MADDLVTAYWLNYDLARNVVRISVKTEAKAWELAAELPPEQAAFLADMLRNEKPIYLTRGADGKPSALHTAEEPTGEHEREEAPKLPPPPR